MALKINITKGEKTVTHFEIVELYFNRYEKFLQVELRGYESSAKADQAKQGNKTDELRFRFSFSGDDFPEVDRPNLINQVEQKIRKTNMHGVDWTKAQ